MVLSQSGACHSASATHWIVPGRQIDRDSFPSATQSIEALVNWERQKLSPDHAPFDVGWDQGCYSGDI